MTSSFHSLHEFLMMGSYGVYVWSTYAIALAIIGMNIFHALQKRRRTHQSLQQFYRTEAPSQKTYALSYDES